MKSIKPNKITHVVLVVFLTCSATSAVSGTKPDSSTASDEQMELIRGMMNETRLSNGLWWYGWMGIYGTLAGASFAVAATTEDKVIQITQNVSGVESLIGFAGVMFTPMPPAYATGKLDSMPYGTEAERQAKLRAAEEYLHETAQTQELGKSWITHVLNITVNAAGGAVIWKGYGNEIRRHNGDPLEEGLINFILGTLIGEIQIFTQPVSGIGQWKTYNDKYKTVSGESQNRVRLYAARGCENIQLGFMMEF